VSLIVAIGVLSVAVVALLAIPLLGPRKFGEERPAYDIGVYRDQLSELEQDRERGLISDEQAEQARREIERRLLAADTRARKDTGFRRGRATTAILLILLPVIPAVAVAVYYTLGQPSLPDQPFAAQTDIQDQPTMAGVAPDIAEMVSRLENRLKTDKDDVEGWLMLARSYMYLQRFQEARQAYLTAWDLTGNLLILADAAEVDVIVGNNVVTPQILELFLDVREAHPLEPKPRYYIGLAKLQSGDVVGGLREWIDLLHLSPPDAPWVESVASQLVQVASEAGIDPASVSPSDEAVALAGERAPAMPPLPATPPAPGPTQEDIENAQEMTADEQTAFIRSMVQRLAEKLEANPNDKEGWLRLARAYQVLGETEKAEEAFARAEAATQ